MKTLFTVLMLMVSAPAFAQSETVSLKTPLMVYAAAVTMDLTTTHMMLNKRTGFVEKNPLGHWASDRPNVLVITSVAMDATAVSVLNHFWGKNHKKAATVVLYTVAAVRFGLAANNYRQFRDTPYRAR